MKKYEFWLHKFSPICFSIAMTITITMYTIALFVTNNKTLLDIIMVTIVIASLIIIFIYILFIRKDTLSKIIFSNKTITLKHFGKEYLSIYWDDIVEINAYIYNLSAKYLSFVTKNARINFHLSKKCMILL